MRLDERRGAPIRLDIGHLTANSCAINASRKIFDESRIEPRGSRTERRAIGIMNSSDRLRRRPVL
jgi:hypothetical protein